MESYLSQPLGLYLFRRYCEAEAHGIEKLFFLQDVYAYRRIPQHNRRVLKAKAIYATYINPQQPPATISSVTQPPPHHTTPQAAGASSAAAAATTPARTHPLLASTKNPGETNYAWKRESSISMTTAKELYCTFKCEAALLGVRGDLTEEIGKQLEDVNLQSGTSMLPLTLFDELEACVVSALEHHQMEGFKASLFFKRFMHFLYIQQREIGEDDFSLLRVLGRGGFGMVNGAIKRSTGKLYAMKAMNKRIIKKKHAEKLCLAERAILTMLSSPFVVCLKYAFQTKEDLFTEEQVMYWSAQILLGLQHLHEKNIVYGCVVYEMLYGKCPFRTSKAKALHADKQKAYDMATLELTPSYDAKYFSPEAADLLQKLLVRDPTKRLGARGADEVKKMKFFENIDWVEMENMAVPPPFVPERDINAASQADIGFFDPSVIQGVKLSDTDQDMYKDWLFCSATAFQHEIVEFMEWEVKQGPITLVTHTNTCCNVS
ncbi:hypothetical protein DYB37_008851 [Aphanomyces astaci]|uniref:G protein-coupled receptor kinase n=2 Tax=Aphanomyces astaci TaxID=112090 RepID=A0A3R7BUX6_APHAT|nr:hypothetical protein DYB35_011087 [Aphanomyces astaci]RHZ03222.1 hypothetical protein DYB37_008851 [Aphanomyces astaci]